MPHLSSKLEIDQAYHLAKNTIPLPYEERILLLKRFQEVASQKKDHLAKTISEEIGKPLWDARNEVESLIQKVPISIQAFNERCEEIMTHTSYRRFKPHGVAVVFGPFNFPMHLPNGHIIPAFLAGNRILFKPSELAPQSGEEYFKLFEEAGFPKGSIQLIHGGKEVGQMLIEDDRLDALLFTGSAATGLFFREHFAKKPEKILALEMGGNNPLVIGSIKHLDAAVYWTLISAYMTAGQRCTCARRLIVIDNELFIQKLVEKISKIKVGAWNEAPEPFMGPVISKEAAAKILQSQEDLLARGGKAIIASTIFNEKFVTPGLIDVTHAKNVPDSEIFGPLLQLIRVQTIDEAIEHANHTAYGLVSAIFTDDDEEFDLFYQQSKTGLINRNAPTTGALSTNPFGGTGLSGNHRPSAYFAADYCSYVLAGIEVPSLENPSKPMPGIEYD